MCVRRMTSRSPTSMPWALRFWRNVSRVEPGPGSTIARWPCDSRSAAAMVCGRPVQRLSSVVIEGMAADSLSQLVNICPVHPRPLSGLLFGLAGWRCKAGATRAPTLPELLAVLGGHALPALVHALFDSPPNIGARRAMAAPSAKEDAAQRQKSQRLPEGDLAPAKERRQQPLPQIHHQFAADGDKYRDRQDRQRSNENPFSFHVVFLISSQIRRECFAIVRADAAPHSVC